MFEVIRWSTLGGPLYFLLHLKLIKQSLYCWRNPKSNKTLPKDLLLDVFADCVLLFVNSPIGNEYSNGLYAIDTRKENITTFVICVWKCVNLIISMKYTKNCFILHAILTTSIAANRIVAACTSHVGQTINHFVTIGLVMSCNYSNWTFLLLFFKNSFVRIKRNKDLKKMYTNFELTQRFKNYFQWIIEFLPYFECAIEDLLGKYRICFTCRDVYSSMVQK